MKFELTEDQALVLFEFLSRLDEQDAFPCEDESEEVVLWAAWTTREGLDGSI